MPKVKRSGAKAPAGWDDIAVRLGEFEREMREAESAGSEGKRKAESVWPVFRVHHQRSRFLYDAFYKHARISRELYDYCLREGYCDAGLIAKWKKQGYERLCCLRCIQTKDHTYATTCVCRVPRDKLDASRSVECVHCGCRGCASGDAKAALVGSGGSGGGEDEEQEEDRAASSSSSSSSSSSASAPAPVALSASSPPIPPPFAFLPAPPMPPGLAMLQVWGPGPWPPGAGPGPVPPWQHQTERQAGQYGGAGAPASSDVAALAEPEVAAEPAALGLGAPARPAR